MYRINTGAIFHRTKPVGICLHNYSWPTFIKPTPPKRKKTKNLNNRRRPASAPLGASIGPVVHSGCRNRLLDPEDQLQREFKREEKQPDAVEKERQGHRERSHSCVEPEVVGGGDNNQQDQQRVSKRGDSVQSADESVLAHRAATFAEESGDQARVVEEGGADCEGVGEVQRGHSGKLVDVAGFGPHAFGVALTHGILEAVGLREQAGRHAGVEGEDEEGGEVGQGHGAAGEGEGVVVGCDVVVPGKEAGMGG